MIVPDLNLLLYAYDSTSPFHARAARWWARCMNGVEPVALPRVVIFGFVRLATSAHVFEAPMSVAEAAACVREWLDRSHVSEADGGAQHVETVLHLLQKAGTAGNLVTDAQIAAVTLEHRARLHTNDTDFGRFPGLKTHNPLGA